MSEILFINKPKGMTSFDLCFKLRKVFKTRSIGHTGTLDPNASGVMIVLINKACKLNQFLVTDTKEYEAKVTFGIQTDTLDIDGCILKEEPYILPLKEDIINVLKQFLGPQKQRPPLTSAIKLNGKKLYEYQRENIEVNIPERDIEIFNIEFVQMHEDGFSFKVKVSSGTYIRSLVDDICKKLNIIGTLSELKRLRVDDIGLEDCDELKDVLNGYYHSYTPYEVLKQKFPIYETNKVDDIKNGKRLFLDRDDEMILVVNNQNALAIYYLEKPGVYASKRGLF